MTEEILEALHETSANIWIEAISISETLLFFLKNYIFESSQEEINSYTVLRTKIFVIRTIHMQNISFLANAPFQYSLETSVNLQTS